MLCPYAEFIMDGNYVCRLDGSPCWDEYGEDCEQNFEEGEDYEED